MNITTADGLSYRCIGQSVEEGHRRDFISAFSVDSDTADVEEELDLSFHCLPHTDLVGSAAGCVVEVEVRIGELCCSAIEIRIRNE
jgi:hypothetical protein